MPAFTSCNCVKNVVVRDKVLGEFESLQAMILFSLFCYENFWMHVSIALGTIEKKSEGRNSNNRTPWENDWKWVFLFAEGITK